MATFAGIPYGIWAASFRCATGRLPDGTPAKMPLGAPGFVNREQFADPGTFAINVAAMLRYYGQLKPWMCEKFGSILEEINAERARVIMRTDCSDIPGFARPKSKQWSPVPDVTDDELGRTITSRYIQAAREYALSEWKREFDSLILNDKVLAIYCCDAPDLSTPCATAADDNSKLSQLLKAIQPITELVQRGDFDMDKISDASEGLREVVSEIITKNKKCDGEYDNEDDANTHDVNAQATSSTDETRKRPGEDHLEASKRLRR